MCRPCRKALACREASPEDMIKAMRLYRAIRKIVDEDRLSALTLSCFRLIEQTGTTGCLALSLLNDEGIIAGCEGDLQSVFTMLAAKVLTGKPAFMANPSMINARTTKSYWRIAPSASHRQSSSSSATTLKRKAASAYREYCLPET